MPVGACVTPASVTTLTPLARVLSFSFYARSWLHTEPPDSLTPSSGCSAASSYSSTSWFPLLRDRSLSLSFPPLPPLSLSDRCSSPFQQPMQYSAALGSHPLGEARWGGCRWPVLVAFPRKKRAPRGRSLGPSNWRRCPSTGARAIASLSLFSLVPPSFRLRSPVRACLSLLFAPFSIAAIPPPSFRANLRQLAANFASHTGDSRFFCVPFCNASARRWRLPWIAKIGQIS